MNINDLNPKDLIASALAESDRIEAEWSVGLDIHLEQSAYSDFEYQLEMDALDVSRRRSLEQIHEISKVLMDNFAINLPTSITNQLICMDTTHKWYGKCECCGAEIIDGLHPVGHYQGDHHVFV